MLTGYYFRMPARVSTGYEDDVSLTGIEIFVFEDEELVHAILLERSYFDDVSDWSNKAAIEYQVLLAANLSLR